LLWFPVIYISTVLPMAICRFVENDLFVPFIATFITNIPFSLSGVLTVFLFYLADKALPSHEQLPTFVVPRKEMRSSVVATGVEPFVLPPTATPPKPQMMRAPADSLTQLSTVRPRSSTYSLGEAHTVTQLSLPTAAFATPASPIPGRSRSADSISTMNGGSVSKYRAKWRGGNLQLSHSNLQSKSEVPKEVRGRRP